MMDYKDQLKLQSYLDGELAESDSREVADWLARDPEAAALKTELDQTRKALSGFEEGIKLPESREFYWSKIRQEIQRQEVPAPPRPSEPWFYRLRRFLVPATGLAVVGLLVLTVTRDTGSADGSVETALEDSGAFTYHDDTAGATLVWLSYPADNEIPDDDDLNSVD
jgi:anti-sigma factor RsiW